MVRDSQVTERKTTLRETTKLREEKEQQREREKGGHEIGGGRQKTEKESRCACRRDSRCARNMYKRSSLESKHGQGRIPMGGKVTVSKR